MLAQIAQRLREVITDPGVFDDDSAECVADRRRLINSFDLDVDQTPDLSEIDSVSTA